MVGIVSAMALQERTGGESSQLLEARCTKVAAEVVGNFVDSEWARIPNEVVVADTLAALV